MALSITQSKAWLEENRSNPFGQGEQAAYQVFRAIVGRQTEEPDVLWLRKNAVGKTIAEMERLIKNSPVGRQAAFNQYPVAEIEKRMPRVEIVSDEQLKNILAEQLQKVFPNVPNIAQLVQEDSSRWSREIRIGLERVGAGEILRRIGETPDIFTPETRQAYQTFAENPLSFPIDTGRPAGQSGAVLGRPVFSAGIPQIPQATVTPAPGQPTGGTGRHLGPTEFENLRIEWTQAFNAAGIRDIGIINEAIEENFLDRRGGDIFLKGTPPSIQSVIQEVQARGTPVLTPEGDIRYEPKPGDNLFAGDPATGTPGTIMQPPAPVEKKPPEKKPEKAPPAPSPEEAPPAEGAPPTGGEAPPAKEAGAEDTGQPGVDAIVEGMLSGFGQEVKDLIKTLTDEFGATIDSFLKGQELNEEEINTKFEEIKEKNINPYFKQLITNYQTDLLFNIGALTGDRRLQLEIESDQYHKQVQQSVADLEARGMTFSGEALKALGAESAFGRRVGAPVAGAPLAGTEIPEGEIPTAFRQMQTSSRARFAQALREQVRTGEQFLGTANIPSAVLTAAGTFTPAGEPLPSSFLSGEEQIGTVERQKRAEELASLESLRRLAGATQEVNDLTAAF